MTRMMKDSSIEWIGEIPESWDMRRVKSSYKNHKDVVGRESFNYERLALTLNGVIKRNKEDTAGLQPENFDTYQILKTNELVFKLIDLQNVSTSRVGYSPFTGIVSPAYIILTPKNKVSSKFGEYYFKSMWQREIFNHIGDDGVRSSLNASDLLNIPYPTLEYSEQEKIAEFLDDKCGAIDEIISKTEQSIEEYKKLKQSVITKAVTKGIRPNRPMQDSNIEWIGEIPTDWATRKIFKLFTQVKNKNAGMVENNLLSLSYGKIIKKNIETSFGLLPESFETYNIIEKDDIVLRLTDLQNDHRSLRVGLCKERGIITSAYVTMRQKDNQYAPYLYYLLHTFDVKKGFYGMGDGVRQGLNWDELKHLSLVLPPPDEQKEITDYLDEKCAEIDTLVEKKQQFLAEMANYKKSLIYEYVTGKKEVA